MLDLKKEGIIKKTVHRLVQSHIQLTISTLHLKRTRLFFGIRPLVADYTMYKLPRHEGSAFCYPNMNISEKYL
jgi:hypothetical protein